MVQAGPPLPGRGLILFVFPLISAHFRAFLLFRQFGKLTRRPRFKRDPSTGSGQAQERRRSVPVGLLFLIPVPFWLISSHSDYPA